MTHVLVMQVKLDQNGDPDEAEKLLNEVVVPLAKSQAGFQKGAWMHDGSGSGMSFIAFASAENAQAAKDVLKPPPGGPQLVSSAVYEVRAEA
jgi:hypothetical protein